MRVLPAMAKVWSTKTGGASSKPLRACFRRYSEAAGPWTMARDISWGVDAADSERSLG